MKDPKIEHKNYRESIQTGVCSRCSSRFGSGVIAARQHMRSNHLNYKCPICSKKFFLQEAVDNHVRSSRHRKKEHTNTETRLVMSSVADISWMAADQFWHVGVLDHTLPEENLDGFMKRKVFPDENYTRKGHELVERLKLFVQHSTPYSVRELFVGGSFGKSTNILDKSDIDLLIYINDYETMYKFRSDLPGILDDLEEHVRKDFNWARKAKSLRKTKFSVQFEVTLSGYERPIKVDLLPALDLLATKTLSSVYDEMKTVSKDHRRNYSACLSKRQTEFVRDVSVNAKNLIRLVKYWKDSKDVPGESYAVELLIIHLWREWGEPESFSMKEKFQKVMEALADFSNIRVLWEDRYNASKYRSIPPRPVLLDAANPFINLEPDEADVNVIMRKARQTLQRMR